MLANRSAGGRDSKASLARGAGPHTLEWLETTRTDGAQRGGRQEEERKRGGDRAIKASKQEKKSLQRGRRDPVGCPFSLRIGSAGTGWAAAGLEDSGTGCVEAGLRREDSPVLIEKQRTKAPRAAGKNNTAMPFDDRISASSATSI
ncbi:hypothetical protein SRHO_G00336920 [Serrasalmus rhombeus]